MDSSEDYVVWVLDQTPLAADEDTADSDTTDEDN